MKDLLQLFKSLSDLNRLRILHALMLHEELCACQITEMLEIASPTTSRHLSILTEAGLLERRKHGRWGYFRLCRDAGYTDQILDWIEPRLYNDPQLKRDRKALDAIINVSCEEISRRRRGKACSRRN